MCVAEEHALAGELVEVRGTDDVVDPASSVSLSVDAGEATPVVGEEKEDVGPSRGLGRVGVGHAE